MYYEERRKKFTIERKNDKNEMKNTTNYKKG